MGKVDNYEAISSKNASINYYRNQLGAYQSQNEMIIEKKSRISAAKERVKNLIADCESVKETIQSKTSSGELYGEWNGRTLEGFDNAINYGITEEYSSFIKQLEEILNILCDEETRLENLYMENYGVIGKMLGIINNLKNEVEKSIN